MEWWILMGLALIAVAAVGGIRLRQPRRSVAKPETDNIYPLW
jgi:hypothetical protein